MSNLGPSPTNGGAVGHLARSASNSLLQAVETHGGFALAIVAVFAPFFYFLVGSRAKETHRTWLIRMVTAPFRTKTMRPIASLEILVLALVPAVIAVPVIEHWRPAIIIAVSVIGALVLCDVFRRIWTSPRLQIIAWKGWEEAKLYKQPDALSISPRLLNFLLYVRGFGAVPKLYSSTGNAYDLLISDLEYLPLYHDAGRVRSVTKVLSKWEELCPLVQEHWEREATTSSDVMGLPLRFGFNELLIDDTLFGKICPGRAAKNASYSDFHPQKILEMDPKGSTKIGIWDYYLPGIGALLLVCDKNLKIDEIAYQDGQKVRDTLATLYTIPKDRVIILDRIEKIEETSRAHDIVAIYGAGSWAIPVPNDNRGAVKGGVRDSHRYHPVVPREGVFMWCECATVLQDEDSDEEPGATRSVRRVADDKNAAKLINHWMSKETQKQLIRGETLRALPVTAEALSHVRTFDAGIRAVRVLEELLDGKDLPGPDITIMPRRIPGPKPIGGGHHKPNGPLRAAWESEWAEFTRHFRPHI